MLVVNFVMSFFFYCVTFLHKLQIFAKKKKNPQFFEKFIMYKFPEMIFEKINK